jgi:hypothetical protein
MSNTAIIVIFHLGKFVIDDSVVNECSKHGGIQEMGSTPDKGTQRLISLGISDYKQNDTWPQ